MYLGVQNVHQLIILIASVPFALLGRPQETCPETGAQTSVPGEIERQSCATSIKRQNAKKEANARVNIAVWSAGAVKGTGTAQSVMGVAKPNQVSQLIAGFWEVKLEGLYDDNECKALVEGIRRGVAIGREPASEIIESPNWPSAYEYASKVSDIIVEDLRCGRLHGPFETPPYKKFIVSPLGAFPKRDRKKIRVIHDLSFPPSQSVNSGINPEEYSLHYVTIDTAVEACHLFHSPVMANLDLKDAYKAVAVREDDWHLLGFKWGPEYFFSRVLSFGLRSAPALFERYAAALQRIMVREGVTAEIVRYVDDFLLIGGSTAAVDAQLDVMVRTARAAGFTIQSDKVTRAQSAVEFLGIVIDAEAQVLKISVERLTEVRSLLSKFNGTTWTTKRKLLKLVGKLAFAARAIRTGRAFLGRLIGLSKRVSQLHHRVRLSESARRDISWWSRCIETHNGTSTAKIDWSVGPIAHVFTDASNHGYGGVWGKLWFAMAYTGESASLADKSINWREMHAAVKSLATWGPELRGSRVIYHIDNTTACHIFNRMYTPIADLMELLRAWCILIEEYNITLAIVYIPTKENVEADLLSRGDIEGFKRVNGPGSRRVWPQAFAYYEELV